MDSGSAPLSDAELFARFTRGDDAAFEQLLRRYQKPVFNFIRRMVGPGSEVEDLAQETFVRVYEQARTLERPDRFRSWLWAIAVNLCRDFFKSQRYRRHASLEVALEAGREPVASESTDQALETAELGRRVEEALRTLAPDRRTIVILREYEELSYEEIAAVLGCPVNRVKWKLHSARQELRRRLAPWMREERR